MSVNPLNLLSDVQHAGMGLGFGRMATIPFVAAAGTEWLPFLTGAAACRVLCAAMTKPVWVLVVDDDASDGIALFRLLEQVGHHATVSGSGRAALDLLRTEPFDVVLIDLTTSDGDGLFDAIQQDDRLSRTPVVSVSAPFDADGVRSTVDAALEKSRAGGQ